MAVPTIVQSELMERPLSPVGPTPRHGTTDPGAHPQAAPRKSKRTLSPVGTTPRHGTTDPGEHPQAAPRKIERPLSQVGTTPQFTRMQYIPQRLQRRLDWTPVALDKWAKPVILLLYAGKDDAGSLDACLHAHHAWISPFIRAIDTRMGPRANRPRYARPGAIQHPVHHGGSRPYPRCLVTGGPNCRTWSILRWFPKPGAPKPVRGRSEEQVWGLPGLTPRDQEDVDNDSTLLLRQMYLTSLAYQGVASQTIPHCPGSFLEHPSDPKETSKSPNAHRCSTIWNTKAYQHWAKTLRHRQVKFDQCQLGQLVAKSTTLSTDLDLGHWTGMICDHPGHPKLVDIASSDLSRYPWKMMKGLAQAIAIRARPIFAEPDTRPAGHNPV